MTSPPAHEDYLATKRFGSLDGLRFLAILAVLLHHSPNRPALAEAHVLFGRGFLGVDFFFVISGFLITTLLMRERDRTGRISLRGFYWRRALRILPLYLLVVTAVGGYYVLVKGSPGTAELWPFYYLFLANFLTSDIPLLAPMWSLAVEEQYYLIWPLLMVLLPRHVLLPALAALILVNAAGILGLLGDGAPVVGPLKLDVLGAPYVPILIGSALAIVLHRPDGFARLRPVLGHRWAAAGYGALLAALLLALPADLAGLPEFALHLAMAAFLGSLVIREGTPLDAVLRARPVARIGAISYGVYLLHLIALDVAVRLTALLGLAADGLVQNLLYAALSIAMAEISFRLFERRFLDLRHKPLGRLPSRRRPSRTETT